MTCRLCRRHLTSPESIRQGMGPVCAAREKQAPMLFAPEEMGPLPGTEVLLLRSPGGEFKPLPGAAAKP